MVPDNIRRQHDRLAQPLGPTDLSSMAKITAVKPQNPKEEFHLHWFGTYSKAKSLAKRAYAPAYIDTKDDLEIYKWKKTKTLEEMTMRVHRSELRFYPFSLTSKNEIPVKIVKEFEVNLL